MKVIDYKWNKRNGNGQTTCHLCKILTWDSWCHDFELKILDEELFNTILCGDCISKIKKETEFKMTSNKEIIEEKEIEELNLMFPICNDIKNAELGGFASIYKSNLINIKYKIDEIIDELNKIKKEGK